MKQKIYLGGYTSIQNKGINYLYLDEESGTLSDSQELCRLSKPSYLLQKDGAIYSCMQYGNEGGVAKIVDGKIESRILLGEASPCHLSYDSLRHFFYVSNYHQGSLSVITEKEGRFIELDRVYHQGKSIHPNQQSSHIHFAQISPCYQYLFVCDLGTDAVYVYSISLDGKLKEEQRIKTPPAFGPRHLSFHPAKPYLYIAGELSNHVLVIRFDFKTLNWQKVQMISTLPEEYHDFNAVAAIRVTADSRFLYVSNRGHNSIAIFEIKAEGDLILLEIVRSGGDFPRDFNFSPAEDYLVIAHQKSGDLSLWARNQKNGQLKLCQSQISAPECVCVVFERN